MAEENTGYEELYKAFNIPAPRTDSGSGTAADEQRKIA
jgi:hypothetical protein